MKTKSYNHLKVNARLTADPKSLNEGNVIRFDAVHNIGSEPLYLSCVIFLNKGKKNEKKDMPVSKLTRGNELVFDGSLRPNNWTDKEGRKHRDYDFVVSRISEPEIIEDNAPAETSEEAEAAEAAAEATAETAQEA